MEGYPMSFGLRPIGGTGHCADKSGAASVGRPGLPGKFPGIMAETGR